MRRLKCPQFLAMNDKFKTESLIYSGNESQCSSEGKTITIKDHITLIMHSVGFKKHYITFDLLTIDQAKQNRIFTRQITANTKILL